MYIYRNGVLWHLYNDGEIGYEVGNSVIIANEFELIEEQEEIKKIDISLKLFEDIEMCLKRISDFLPNAGYKTARNYIERYENDLKSYKTKQDYDEKTRKRYGFLFETQEACKAWQSVYNTPKMPVYSSKHISFNYYNGNSGAGDVYLKISKVLL